MLGGIIGTVLGWIGYHAGLRTDAASASGSLHAKIAELRARLLERPTSPIKSIQRGTATISSTDTLSVTISSITTSKAELKFSHHVDSMTSAESVGASWRSGTVSGKIASSTSLTFSRGYTSATVIIEWEVIEYN